MRSSRPSSGRRRSRRGAALLIALALILTLTVVVAATQVQVISQLALSRRERDYERALQCAEAGVNAYLNRLSYGTGSVPAAIPAYTLAGFRQAVRDGTVTLTRYPSGSTTQGYYVGHAGTVGSFVTILGYGWSNGVVRRVKASGRAFSIFDWAAIYGLDPAPGSYAWKFTGNAKVVGASGADGKLFLSPGANVTWYDGPVIWAGPGAQSNPNPPVYPSGPNIPLGHPSTPDHIHILSNPPVRRYARPLGFPTADEAANQWVNTTLGVEYFRTNNHNATGLRYLVRDTVTGVIRELSGNYTVLAAGDFELDNELSPPTGQLNQMGMTASEVFYGVRAYPGNYYFTAVQMGPADRILLRSFKDSERTIPAVNAQRTPIIDGDPANPNPGQAENQNIRVWLGDPTSGPIPNTTFSYQTQMEYPRFASRFRVYNASHGSVIIKGTNDDPPPPFRVNLLAYNRDSNGGYGSVQFVSSVYLFGSLIAWRIDVSGGTTIEKEVPELGPDDRFAYVTTDWTELQ